MIIIFAPLLPVSLNVTNPVPPALAVATGWKVEQRDNEKHSACTLSRRPYRNYKAPLLEVFDQRNGVLFEVGQAAVDGLGVVVRSPLLLGSFLQPLLQTVVGAGQEHHQVRSADLWGERRRGRHDGRSETALIDSHSYVKRTMVAGGSSVSELRHSGGTREAARGQSLSLNWMHSGQNVKTAIHASIKTSLSVSSEEIGYYISFSSVSFFVFLSESTTWISLHWIGVATTWDHGNENSLKRLHRGCNFNTVGITSQTKWHCTFATGDKNTISCHTHADCLCVVKVVFFFFFLWHDQQRVTF